MLASDDASIIACHKGKGIVLQRFHSFTFAGSWGVQQNKLQGGKREGDI